MAFTLNTRGLCRNKATTSACSAACAVRRPLEESMCSACMKAVDSTNATAEMFKP